MIQHSPILVLAPHTDDGELGCGGLISKYIEKGADVYYVAFSNAHISLPAGYHKDTLIKEMSAATAVLGIPSNNLLLYDFPVRNFPDKRQEILQTMIGLRESISPKLVLCPSLNDIHQDHETIAQEALRCFKKQSILCYEEPWNNIAFSTDCFISFEKYHLDRKIEALKCYASQGHRSYINSESIRSLAITRGSQLEGGYAEAFEIIRWML
ncbi:PIG-L family deacetylase [bacterium]|jgi:N-acetylglucosamine malate deacetylase 1|nr:PIG-L family deacetylase [bacterium]